MKVSTPCINLCIIDETTGVCIGCLRNRTEIVVWGRLTEAERQTIMADLPKRSAHHQAVKVAQANEKQE